MSDLHKCGSILVTGASRGIGLQIVETLMKSNPRPEKVIAAARDRSRATELNRLAESHPDLHIVTLDVTNKDDIEAAFKEVESLVGDKGLNCLVNNAGIKLDSTLSDVTAEEMMKNFEVNAVSPLMVTKAFLPLLRKAAKQGTGMGIHRAAIVNVSSARASMQRKDAHVKRYPYCASKAALNMVTRCLSSDLLGEGILCVSVNPGWVKTDMGGPQNDVDPEVQTLTAAVLHSLCADQSPFTTPQLQFLNEPLLSPSSELLKKREEPAEVTSPSEAPPTKRTYRKAHLTKEESINNVLKVISNLSEKDSGGFLNHTGETLPW